MTTQIFADDLPQDQAFPDLAATLRAESQRIIDRWEELATILVPATASGPQLRNHLPNILNGIDQALGTGAEYKLIDATQTHAAERFRDAYAIEAIFIEFRLLRRVIMKELNEALVGTITSDEMIALDMGIDLALQESLTALVTLQQEKLKTATEARAKYLAFLSHDLRHHLNHVMLTLELVSADLADVPQLAQRTEDVDAAKQAIHDTMEGMGVLLSAEQMKRKSTKHEPLDLHEIAGGVVKQFSKEASTLGVKLVLETPMTAVVKSDRGLIAIILQNLLSNAVKYSPAGGTVTVKAQTVGDGGSEGCIISVTDQGPGIDCEKGLAQSSTRGEKRPGTGLGLHIVREASELLGARIVIGSEPGAGTEVAVALPAEACSSR